MAASWGNGNFIAQQDCSCCNFAAVNPRVCFVVWTQGGTLEGNAGKQSAGTRIAEYLCAHPEIGVSGSITPFWTCSGGCVSTELDLTAENGSRAFLVHDQENQIGGFAPELHSDAIAFESVHCGSTPRSVEFLAGAANHRSATVLFAHSEGQPQYGGEHDDTLSSCQNLLGQTVWDV